MGADPLAALRAEIVSHGGCGFEPCETASRMVPGEGNPRRRRGVRRRGARRHRGRSSGGRSSAAPGSCSTSCWPRPGWRARTSGSRTWSRRARRRTATRRRPRSRTACRGCERELELIRPRLVVPLGRHALKHFAPDGEDRRGPRRALLDGAPVPALPPGGGDVQPDAAGDAVRRRPRATRRARRARRAAPPRRGRRGRRRPT